ncbi:MAG: serine/threonine protein kinase, partial [Chloroflexota bacterium]|nr:serine/threonine protein kinase [Chloroflexota bacterium]
MLDIAPGTALGPYVIVGHLGRGGMATVYRAHHAALERDVAIKVVWPSLADSPGFLERFRREARAVSHLRHPNILTIYDFGRHDGVTYMVTELLPGGSLADRLGRPLPLRDAVVVARGVAAALDYAHAQGIVHRDVKPSNILFTADGTPVLADFGIARMSAESEQLTVQGSLVGTPEYMSPEQALGDPVGPASDIYSLGVVLYQMVTGAPPFQSATAVATLRAQVEEPMPPTRLVNPTLPPRVDMVLERALSKSPRRRYASATALADAFERAVAGASTVATPMDPTMAVDPTMAGGMASPRATVAYAEPTGVLPVQRRSRLLPALLALLAVSVAAGVLAFLLR